MFKNRLPVPPFAVFRILVAIVFLTSCFGKLPKPKQTTLDSGDYEIDGLVNGVPNDLSPLQFRLSTRAVDPRHTGVAVTWSQREFETIRLSFIEQVLRDAPERWEMAHMTFRLDCRDVGVGKQVGVFLMFRNSGDFLHKARVERHLGVFPQDRVITYWEVLEEVPELQPLTAIDMKRVKISADQALQIAERNGGSAKRGEVRDDCGIDVYMLGWQGNQWRVEYTYLLSAKRSETFRVIVDAETGKVK